jgi:cytoskeletal protein CcmA (bactofilin family)
MWKRDESVRPSSAGAATINEQGQSVATTSAARNTSEDTKTNIRDVVNVGKSVVIKGEVNGSEDLTIEGQVDGKIELRQHMLTIGPNGRITAEVFAKSVVILGAVIGNVTATEKVNIRESGSVDGDITAPRVAIAEGAHFRGNVDMSTKKPTSTLKEETGTVRPAKSASKAAGPRTT